MIIAAYAGCGKTTFTEICGEVIDLHCLPYKYYLDDNNNRGEAGKADPYNEMRPEWPFNYVEAIENVMNKNKYKFILIPSDFRVLSLLNKKQIPYTLVYPHRDCREEYRQRYIARGNTENFLEIFIGNWDWFIDNLKAYSHCKHIVLESNQFLADVIDK